MKYLILIFGIFCLINCKYENNIEDDLKETDYSSLENILENYADQVAVSVVPLENKHTPFFFNESKVFVSASMIKLLILCEFIDQIDNEIITLDSNYTYKEEDKVGGAGVIQTMDFGTIFSYDTLAFYMIKYSDNIATNVLIDILGKDNINKKSKELGLKSTQLNRKMMTPGTENFISCEDIEVILKGILYKNIGSEEMCERAMYYLLENDDFDGIARGLPEGTKFAHKTGSLTKIRHDGGIVFLDNNDKYIIIVLTQGFIQELEANYLIGNISLVVFDIMTIEPQPETDTSDGQKEDTSDIPVDTSDDTTTDTSDNISDTTDNKGNYLKYSIMSIYLLLSLLI